MYAFCGSKFTSSDVNMINCLKNSLIKAINNHGKFPEFIVVVLDYDLVEYVNFEGPGLAGILGVMIEWLAKKFLALITDQQKILLNRAKKPGYPQIYWVALPHHSKFTDNGVSTLITNCLESVFKVYSDIRLIHMKEIWDYENPDLVDNFGQITDIGLTAYWRSVDAAVKFNAQKHDLFLARCLLKPSTPQHSSKDKMLDFFQRKRSQKSAQHNTSTKRRKLPTP